MSGKATSSSGSWSGELDIAPSWGLFVGTGGTTRKHRHLADKLVIVLGSGVDVDPAELVAPGLWWVQAGRLHRCHASGRVALVFFEPGCLGPIDVPASLRPILHLRDSLRELSDPELRCRAVTTLVEALPRMSDPRVGRAAALLVDEPHLTASELATRVGLSPTRLTHLFTERVGAAPRQYRTWGALRRAVGLMAKGLSLTETAHAAGFADSAHLSRCFSQMLGMPPSTIARSCTIRLRR